MKRLPIFITGILCLTGWQGFAQKKVPYTYSFMHQADSLQQGRLQVLTEVNYTNTASLRLYFKDTQLGDNSYLLLEAADGAKQELRKKDLENWRYSSAYFNGNQVKVALFSAPGDKNSVRISEIKVSERQPERNQGGRISSETRQASARTASSVPLEETYPYAAAVGRFTDGTNSFGTGWIAPNGAIVTSGNMFEIVGDVYDLIEFNVPPSDGTTVTHPGPEDQYPVVPKANTASNVGPTFKNEPPNSVYTGGWVLLEALPNSTGLRPGERQGQFFRIANSPGSAATSSDNIHVDIFHYGKPLKVSGSGQFPTLQLETTTLLPPKDHLKSNAGVIYYDREWFLLYEAPGLQDFQDPQQKGSDTGGPITYQSSNYAIGVHNRNAQNVPAYGTGFINDHFRNYLDDLFSPKSVYVDDEYSLTPGDGTITKPYLTLWSAGQYAPDGAQVYIAKGVYSPAFTIDRPMTLRAPVGKVVLGAPNSGARTAAHPTIPAEWLGGNPVALSDQEEQAELPVATTHPNPFSDRTELQYSLPAEMAVTVEVFDILGNRIGTLLQARQAAGNHSVVWDGRNQSGKPASSGLYILKLQTGTQIRSVRVIKK